MLLTHRQLPAEPPSIRLGDVELSPQPRIKWLGVLIDPKFSFTGHINAQTAKGIIVVNRLARLACTGWGTPLKQCLQLTASLIHSRVDYAGVFWHRYGRTTGPPSKLQRIDQIVYRFALGVFKTHPSTFLRHNTCSAPAHARLDAKTDTAILRVLCLPESTPAARLTRAIFARNRKTHHSTVHHTLGRTDSICGSIRMLPELLDAGKARLPPHPDKRGVIMPTMDEAKDPVLSNISTPPPNTVIHFSDGLHSPDHEAGAAALQHSTDRSEPTTLKVRVGDAKRNHSVPSRASGNRARGGKYKSTRPMQH